MCDDPSASRWMCPISRFVREVPGGRGMEGSRKSAGWREGGLVVVGVRERSMRIGDEEVGVELQRECS